jgi:hypothetical protein
VVGRYAWLADRRVRVQRPAGVADGWWRVRVQGRVAEPIAPATTEEIAGAFQPLPRLRGHLLRLHGGVALVDGNATCHPVDLAPPDEDPPLLAPASARRWPTGDLLLWEQLEWEGEVEETARRALEAHTGLAECKGISASLRASFAFATAGAASRALHIQAEPAEVKRWVGEIADQGYPRAEVALRALAHERARWDPPAPVVPPVPARPMPAADLEGRVDESLRAAGARLSSVRRQGGGVVEVRWLFDGQHFISLVAEEGLRVIDSGVCLAGQDDLVTLDSLPGVIREAIAEEALVITRHEGDD